MSASSTVLTQVYNNLATTRSLHPTQAWLSNFIQNQKSTTSVSVLSQSASFRLLASDITQTLDRGTSPCLPIDVSNANVKERHIPGPVVTQVLGVEDLSKSRWEQIEAIEALERGEGTKGREIIRVTETAEDDVAVSVTAKSGGPHKVLLQDVRGTKVYGMELRPVNGISTSMSIGSKLLLKDITVARGMLLINQASTSCLGGKIDELIESWKKGRKEELKAAIGANEPVARNAV